jgi:uncharacterized C2H2 Zn-finger protein
MPAERKTQNPGSQFRCKQCGKCFDKSPNLSKHLGKNHDCREKSRLSLQRHILEQQQNTYQPATATDNSTRQRNLFDDYYDASGEMRGWEPLVLSDGEFMSDSEDEKLGFEIEEYPEQLIVYEGKQPTRLECQQDHNAGNTHLDDPNTWSLAFWLMTSGLSGKARDKFLKLEIVSAT